MYDTSRVEHPDIEASYSLSGNFKQETTRKMRIVLGEVAGLKTYLFPIYPSKNDTMILVQIYQLSSFVLAHF
jgi:hypothetical protein